MKNVRLFTVAAALGMFASTVVAAEPTKTVTWSDVDSVIKVDLGDKLITKAPTATVTSSEEKVEIGNIYAVNYEVNQEQNWLYTDAFHWQNTADAKKILGLNGYRFLAPGAAEVDEEVFVDQASGTVYDGIDAMFDALVKKEYVRVKYDKDGDIEYADIPVDWDYYASGATKVETIIRLTSQSRRADDHIKEDIIDYLVNGVALDASQTGYYTAKVYTVDTKHYGTAAASITVVDADDATKFVNPTLLETTKYGAVVLVDSKRGTYYVDDSEAVRYGESKLAYTAKTLNSSKQPSAAAGATKVSGNIAVNDEVYFGANETTPTTLIYATTDPAGGSDLSDANLASLAAGTLLKAGSADDKYKVAVKPESAVSPENGTYIKNGADYVTVSSTQTSGTFQKATAATVINDYNTQLYAADNTPAGGTKVMKLAGANDYDYVADGSTLSADDKFVEVSPATQGTHFDVVNDKVVVKEGIKNVFIVEDATPTNVTVVDSGNTAKAGSGFSYFYTTDEELTTVHGTQNVYVLPANANYDLYVGASASSLTKVVSGQTLVGSETNFYKTTSNTIITAKAEVAGDTGAALTAVWSGSAVVAKANLYTTVNSQAYTTPVSVTSLDKSTTYVATSAGTTAFTASDVTYLGSALNSKDTDPANDDAAKNNSSYNHNGGVITEEYVAVNDDYSRTCLDAIAYVTKDELGYTSRHIVSYTDVDIYFEVQSNNQYGLGAKVGDLVKIDKYNHELLFTASNMANMVIDGKKLSSLDGNVYPQSTSYKYGYVDGYAGLVKETYDHVWGGLGYNKTNKYAPANWTIGTAVYSVANDQAYPANAYDNTEYNQLTKYGKAGTVAIVDIHDADFDATGVQYGQGASLVARITLPGIENYDWAQNYVIAVDEEVKLDTERATLTNIGNYTTAGTYGSLDHAGEYGIYELVGVPANNTDKYVLVDNDWDSTKGEYQTYTGLDLSKIWSYSEAKGTGTLDALDGTDIECSAVQLERKGKFFPAFDSEEALYAAVLKITGLDKALEGSAIDTKTSTFKTWFTKNVNSYDHGVTATSTKMNVDGIVHVKANDVNYASLCADIPVKAIVETTKVVDSTSSEVTVTSNLAEIDTTVAGVKTLTYTATYNGEVVDTKDVTVVVAPSYKRTWKNGRVATLTSYYVNDPTAKYAFYEYDWTAKKATVTFYNLDGSVAETTSIAL